jgi:hypothetical protein
LSAWVVLGDERDTVAFPEPVVDRVEGEFVWAEFAACGA